MANRSDPLVQDVHGANPQRIIEKILRTKIYQSIYWKEQCFGLTAETLVDRAIELTHIGGTYGGTRKPTKFMCLFLKMLQIQPEADIILEFIKNEDYKYVRCLGALYLRCVGRPVQIYKFLEPLYADASKIRLRAYDGWSILHVDEFIDQLLFSDYSCDITLPHLPKRWHLESQGLLKGPRQSLLPDDDNDEDSQEETSGVATTLSRDAVNEASHDKEKAKKKKKKKGTTERGAALFKKKRPRYPSDEDDDNTNKQLRTSSTDDLDIEATNALRAKLGLNPLRL
mmetsp:Transcript_3881/g.5422  ORF Transcript_3881/g.5422 Transcript_3881/m.5422 type:complete len:284 (+) Transcript_3881:827-1678(+)